MSESLGGGSSLVAAAGLAIRGGGVTVPFGGVHRDGGATDALGALLGLATQDRWATSTRPRNALAVRIGRVATALIVGARGPEGRDPSPTHRDDEFYAEAKSNPTFVFDQPRSAEGMVVFRHRRLASPTYEGAQRLGEALECVIGGAIAQDAPTLFLYSPSSPPSRGKRGTRGDGSRQQWGWASRACLRFAVGIPRSDPLGRFRFQHALLDLCTRRRYALHLADRRYPRRGGHWFELSPGSSEGPEGETPIGRVVPLTVVGPARARSVGAVISHLRRSGVAIVGTAITALGEIALINVLVADPTEGEAARPEDHSAVATLEWVTRSYGPGHDPMAGDARACLAGHLGFVGTSRSAERPPDRRALWVAWEAPAAWGSPLPTFATCLKEAIEAVARAEGIDIAAEHLVLRCVSEDLARGRCKLSTEWDHLRKTPEDHRRRAGAHAAAAGLAGALERECRRRLAAASPALAAATEVQVSPYESLLGRWQTPVPVS